VREAIETPTLNKMSRRIPFDQTLRARELRNSATRHEHKLWGMIWPEGGGIPGSAGMTSWERSNLRHALKAAFGCHF